MNGTVELPVPSNNLRMKSRVTVIVLVVVACVAWGLSNVLIYPPGVSPDSLEQYEQALQGAYGTLQPPFISMLMRVCNLIAHPSIHNYTLFQSALFFGAIAVFTASMVRGAAARVLIAALMMFNPISMIYAVTAWHDVLMASFMMLALSAGLAHLARPNTWNLVFATACCFLGLSARHEAVVVSVPLAALILIWVWRTRGTTGRRFGLALLLAIAISIPMSKVWEHLPGVNRYLPWSHLLVMSQYVGTLYHARLNGKDATPAFQHYAGEIDRTFGPETAERLLATYNPMPNYYDWLSVNPIIGFNKAVAYGHFFLREFPSLVATFPREWAQAKVTNIKLFLTDLPPQFCLEVCCVESAKKPAVLATLGLSAQSSARLRTIQQNIAKSTDRLMRATPLKLGLAIPLMLLAFVYGCLRRDPRYLAPPVAALAHASVFLAVDVYWEWRYFLFFFLVYTVVMAALAVDGIGALARAIRARRVQAEPAT
jgi:hypothetical protein